MHVILFALFYYLTKNLSTQHITPTSYLLAIGIIAPLLLLTICFSITNNTLSNAIKSFIKHRFVFIISATACFIIFVLDSAYSIKGSETYQNNMWIQMPKALTFHGVKILLSLFFTDIVFNLDLLQIGTASFYIEINHPCSGSLGISLFLVSSYAFYLMQKDQIKIQKRTLFYLLLLGLIFSFTGNMIRIAALISLGHWGYTDWAIFGFHEGLGVTFFLALFMMYAFLLKSLNQNKSKPLNKGDDAESKLPWLYIGPFLLWFLLGVLSITFTPNLKIASACKIFFAIILWAALFRKSIPKITFQNPKLITWLFAGLTVLVYTLYGFYFPHQMSRFSPEQKNSLFLLIFYGIGFCLITPVVEEVFFRGFLPRMIQDFKFWNLPYEKLNRHGILISSFLFSVLHTAIFPAFFTGLFACFLLKKTNSLQQAVYFHTFVNTAMFFGSIYWDSGF